MELNLNSKKINNLAFVFPGQGSQRVGMGKDLYQNFTSAREVFELVDEVLSFSLTKIMWEGDIDLLTQTQNTQPAIVAVSLAAFKVLVDEGLLPLAVAGHSVGEYTALAAAGVLKLEDTIKLVRKRGQFMQSASTKYPGGMAAIIGLEVELIEEICGGLRSLGTIQIANINSPVQVVISGDDFLIEKAMNLAKEKGAVRAVKLNVAGAFHSELMNSAKTLLVEEIEKIEFYPPKLKVYTNFTGNLVNDKEELKIALCNQITSKVLWFDIINNMIKNNISTFVELGGGASLSGLIRKIDRKSSVFNIEDEKTFQEVKSKISGEESAIKK